MTEKRRIPESELIINPDGSIYHLHLQPHQIAETIITVGDPGRVPEVSKHFDSIQHKVLYREFLTHTGYLNNKPLTVISTGIGTDNIDIVMNELDALVNIDFETRTVKDALTSLQLIRMGTSGAASADVAIDSILLSEVAIGMDGLMNFYELENSIWETVYLEAFISHIKPYFKEIKPYIASADPALLEKFDKHYAKGTTVTASGFYGPQGRTLRAKNEFKNFAGVINQFRHKHFSISNLEMETAGIYGFGKILGHQCLSINAILADRVNQKFSTNPQKVIDKMIEESLEIITTS
jgi:uridine phosphorylase